MIDLIQSKPIKKAKKLKSLENTKLDTLEKPSKRKRKSNIFEPESTTTEVEPKVITPPSSPSSSGDSISVEFVQSGKQLSPFAEIDESAPLSEIIGRRSVIHPQTSLKCVWTSKDKVLKKNCATCCAFTLLEKDTLELLYNAVKSKKKFGQVFRDFETAALQLQCDYPHAKSQCDTPRACTKSKKDGLKLGSKHPRSEVVAKKAKYSIYFINKVCNIMLQHAKIWDEAIMVRLLQTKQLRTRHVPDLPLHLLKHRSLALFKMSVKWLKPWQEPLIVEIILYILKENQYMSGEADSTDKIDGKERQELDEYLILALDMKFDRQAMFGALRVLNADQAKALLKFISDKLNSSCVKKCKGETLQLVLPQVVAWIEVVVEAFFGSLTDETDLIKIIYNNVTNMINSCRNTTALSEHMFRIRHPAKFRPKVAKAPYVKPVPEKIEDDEEDDE